MPVPVAQVGTPRPGPVEKLAGHCRQRAGARGFSGPGPWPQAPAPIRSSASRHTWPAPSLAHRHGLPGPSVALDMDPDLRTRHPSPATHNSPGRGTWGLVTSCPPGPCLPPLRSGGPGGQGEALADARGAGWGTTPIISQCRVLLRAPLRCLSLAQSWQELTPTDTPARQLGGPAEARSRGQGAEDRPPSSATSPPFPSHSEACPGSGRALRDPRVARNQSCLRFPRRTSSGGGRGSTWCFFAFLAEL